MGAQEVNRRGARSGSLPLYASDSPDNSGAGDYRYVAGSPRSVRRWAHIKVLFVIVAVLMSVVNYCERVYPRKIIQQCQWDRWESWDKEKGTASRVLLIADPQILDHYSYPERPSWVRFWTRKMGDNYLHRNYMYLQEVLDAGTTIFLGDNFDGGREQPSDTEWLAEYHRFMDLYPQKVNRRYYTSVPGNHDIGFQTINKAYAQRFDAFFGDANQFVEIGNHSFVWLDTISLRHEHPDINGKSKEFLNDVNNILNPQFPRILLSHVPLFRNTENQVCGPLRESSKRFPLQAGDQYQTVIDYEVSQLVLGKLHPTLIFAGDDHDYCEIEQTFKYNGKSVSAREITVKSASMNMGIKRPAVQLLSLNNPYDPNPKTTEDVLEETYQTEMCYLPNPFHTIQYGLLTVGIIIFFLYAFYVQPKQTRTILVRFKLWSLLFPSSNYTPITDHDDDKWRPKEDRGEGGFPPSEKNISAFLLYTSATIFSFIVIFAWYIS